MHPETRRFVQGCLLALPLSLLLWAGILFGLGGIASAVRGKPTPGARAVVATLTPRAHLPLVVAQSIKGVALTSAVAHYADVATVNAGWYYTWSETFSKTSLVSAEFVPMVHGPTLSIPCPARLLVFNEPDLDTSPYSYHVSPADAAVKVAAIADLCPDTALVIGNVSQDGLGWLLEFQAEYDALPNRGPYVGAYGFHAYCWQTATGCLSVIAAFSAALPGRELWLSEMAVFHAYDTPQEVERLMAAAQACCARYAWYTNRAWPPGDPWTDREFYLFDSAGALTPAGQAFEAWAQ